MHVPGTHFASSLPPTPPFKKSINRSDFLPPCFPRRLTRRQFALCGVVGTILFIILIVLIAAAAKRKANDMLMPGGDQGAALSGAYRNLFVEFLDKTPAEVDAKLECVVVVVVAWSCGRISSGGFMTHIVFLLMTD